MDGMVKGIGYRHGTGTVRIIEAFFLSVCHKMGSVRWALGSRL